MPYDIFISYRHSDTADKAEHLHSLLEGAGYKDRVSFDRENLIGRFDLEILRRLDACTDFIAVIGFHTLDKLSEAETDWYKKLAVCSVEEFPELEAQCIEAKIKRMEAQGMTVTKDDKHIDFVRLEIARSIVNNKNIIPVVPVKTDDFDFYTLALPEDITLLKKYQAVMYQDSKDFMFKDNLPHIISRMKSKFVGPTPNPKRYLVWLIGVAVLLFLGIGLYGGWRWHNEKEQFDACRTQQQYEELAGSSLFYAGECADSIKALITLKGTGNTAINDAKGRGTKDSVLVSWNEDCSLNQIRVLKNIINNMMLVPAGTFMMGTDKPEGIPNPRQEVTIKDDYYLCKFELTEREWNVIMKDSLVGSDKLPKTDISWNECQDFLNVISRLTGRTFALPSAEQWEYAAGYNHPEWIYAGGSDARKVAVFDTNEKQNIDSNTPNELEIYCLSGNVAEWTSDGDDAKKIIRGGSYASAEDEVTITYTDTANPATGSKYIGIRLMIIK